MSIQALPDITSELNIQTLPNLNWVGMEKISVPILLNTDNDEFKNIERYQAKANIFVNIIDNHAKGIHMSRLHKILNQLEHSELDQTLIKDLLSKSISSQNKISDSAKIDLNLDLQLKKPALLSDEFGYQSYPITIKTELLKDKLDTQIEFSISYSSTCPCSASLSRQLFAKAVDEKFDDELINKSDFLKWAQSKQASIATPHSQRSYAKIKFSIADNPWPNLKDLILEFETAIKSVVQTAVKREDEQAFAKLNAENLMFCEDAARIVKEKLESLVYIENYWFKIEHQESLHDHNAVVIDYKRK